MGAAAKMVTMAENFFSIRPFSLLYLHNLPVRLLNFSNQTGPCLRPSSCWSSTSALICPCFSTLHMHCGPLSTSESHPKRIQSRLLREIEKSVGLRKPGESFPELLCFYKSITMATASCYTEWAAVKHVLKIVPWILFLTLRLR